MFFYASKILWFIAQPSSAMLLVLSAGIVMLWSRWARLGRRLVLGAGIALIVCGFSPLGNILILPLENRFDRADLTVGPPPDGIIVLGGSQDMSIEAARGTVAVNEGAERIIEAMSLALRFPEAKIVFTGGSAALVEKEPAEAKGAANLFAGFDLSQERFILEGRSRNTYQNAQYSRELVKPAPGSRWLLVTSANHMPRSMGCFRAVGFAVEPWPVDFRTRGPQDVTRFFSTPSDGIVRVDRAVREWAGLLAYWITGRSSSLFPAPH